MKRLEQSRGGLSQPLADAAHVEQLLASNPAEDGSAPRYKHRTYSSLGRAELVLLLASLTASSPSTVRADSAIWLLSIKRNADLNLEVDAHSTCVGMLIYA
jgi:hypothetical protein